MIIKIGYYYIDSYFYKPMGVVLDSDLVDRDLTRKVSKGSSNRDQGYFQEILLCDLFIDY